MKKLDIDFVTLKIEDRVSIMNATGLELIKIINSFLSELDNYMQIIINAGDENLANEISNDYNVIEKMSNKLSVNNTSAVMTEKEVAIDNLVKMVKPNGLLSTTYSENISGMYHLFNGLHVKNI